MIRIYMYGEVPNSEIFARRNLSADVSDVVSDIIDNVRKKGDTALFEYTQKFDGADLINLEVTEAEKEEAFASVDSKFLEILREAAPDTTTIPHLRHMPLLYVPQSHACVFL